MFSVLPQLHYSHCYGHLGPGSMKTLQSESICPNCNCHWQQCPTSPTRFNGFHYLRQVERSTGTMTNASGRLQGHLN